MEEVLQLLESIPNKVVNDHNKNCQRLRQMVKLCLQDNKQYIVEPSNNLPECIQILCSLKNYDESEHKALIQTDDSSKIKAAVSSLKSRFSDGRCCLSDLLNAFLANKIPLPLELLVLLQNSEIMQATTYLSKYIERYEDATWFVNSLVWLVKSNASQHSSIIVPMLSTLLAVREPGSLTCAQDLSSLSTMLTDQFCAQVVEWVLGLPEDEVSSNNINYFSQLTATGQLSKSSIRPLALVHLIKLTSTLDLDQIIPLTQVPEFQSKKWKLSLTQPPLKSLLIEVVAVVGAEEVLRCVLSCLGKPQVNWKILLLLTSCALLLEDGAEKTSAFIDQLLRRGLECDIDLNLGASLLFARQCCHEATSQFGTYSQWFSAHFGAGSASARSANQYQSLLQVLVSLVPAEPPAILRVHLNAVPKAPTSCHSLLRDYTELARARLDDLKEPAEMEGLFLDSYDGEQDTRARDVERVLEHFSRTEKVLKVVLEAAVFRRKYFEGVFLVELLQLPGWSQRESTSEANGVRHAFIEKLKSLDKIPSKLSSAYNKYGDGGTTLGGKHKHAAMETNVGQKNKKKTQIKKKR